MANISFLDDDIRHKVVLGIHAVNNLSDLSRVQILQKIVFVDRVLYEFFRSANRKSLGFQRNFRKPQLSFFIFWFFISPFNVITIIIIIIIVIIE